MFSLKYSLEVFLPKLWPPVFRAFKLSESPTLPRSLQSIIFTRVYGLYSLRVAVPPPPPPVKWVFHQGEGRVRLHVD